MLLIRYARLSSHRAQAGAIPWLPCSCWEVMRVPWAAALNGWAETLQNCLPSAAVLVEVYVNRKLRRPGPGGGGGSAHRSHCAWHTAGERSHSRPARAIEAGSHHCIIAPSHPDQHRSLLWDQSLGPSAPVPGAVQLSRILALKHGSPGQMETAAKPPRQGDGSLHLEAPDGLVSSSLYSAGCTSLIQKLQDPVQFRVSDGMSSVMERQVTYWLNFCFFNYVKVMRCRSARFW